MLIRRVAILVILALALLTAGCSRMDREQLKSAREAQKKGQWQQAVNNAQTVLRRSPRNIFARYRLGKIKSDLLAAAQEDLEAENYKGAVKKTEILLEIVPDNKVAKAVHARSRKHLLFAEAKKAFENEDPMTAHVKLTEVLKLDPEFAEAKALQAEAKIKVDEKIGNLVTTAEKLIQQGRFEELRKLAQDILAIDPQNSQADAFRREAQAQILMGEREKNLAMARKFYEERLYESALEKAEAVLRVDPQSTEAKRLVEASRAELTRPELRLTGLTKIKGKVIAHIEIISTRKKFRVEEGDTFGEFKVSLIDFDLKAIVITFVKTGSQHSYKIAIE